MHQATPELVVSSFPLAQLVPVVFTFLFVIWFIYTLVAAYHWIRYSSNLIVGLGAMGAHLTVSSLLAIYAVSGLH